MRKWIFIISVLFFSSQGLAIENNGSDQKLDYADEWEIIDGNGLQLAYRTITHPPC